MVFLFRIFYTAFNEGLIERIIMLKGRKLILTVEKDEEGVPMERGNDKIFEDRMALSHKVIRDVVKTIFRGVCTYVVLDTFRQVLIARNTNVQVYK